jgi:hypothetical protein
MIINEEEFRIIHEHEDYIINCDGTKCRKINGIIYYEKYGFVRKPEGRQIKQNRWGEYLFYQLCENGKKLTIGTHVLVCLAWNGPKVENKQSALHRDDNKLNNLYTNLYWGTQKDNVRDAIQNNRRPQNQKRK